jgi:hypothetical protein
MLVTNIIIIIILFLCIYFLIKTVKSSRQDFKYLNEDYAIVRGDLEEWKKRCNALEDSVEHGFGIKVRNEVTKIDCEFSKLEMVMIIAGIEKLIKDSKHIDDTEIYINFFKKLNIQLEMMEE